jgi:hypothetical protein
MDDRQVTQRLLWWRNLFVLVFLLGFALKYFGQLEPLATWVAWVSFVSGFVLQLLASVRAWGSE